jgi:lipopolysaccharide transport system ATP-binding protein
MSRPAIEVSGLGKHYVIRHESRHDNLRDTLHHTARKLWRRLRWGTGFATEDFWALRDVSFSIQPGEVVGIIGRNGAGKSTLLKILSRITEPTEGRVTLRGRVASLLEVGTGFHPDLSGRENIFLNGAILGMSRVEIRKKFDEIVAFAEVEKFIDTPVKHYSSGMYVRLAFAVAAHLEPEILIVDEVLAVGDAAFQKKCLGKMQDVARNHGRTVFFVSHDLGAVTSLTSRCLLLELGRLSREGPTHDVVGAYFRKPGPAGIYRASADLPGRPAYISEIRILTSKDHAIQAVGDSLEIHFTLWTDHPIAQACLSFQIVNQFQQPATHAWLYPPDATFCQKAGESHLRCVFPRVHLNVGQFSIRAFFTEPPGGRTFDNVEGVCSFEVVNLGATVLWGWRPDSCAYHEECSWKIETK